MLNFKIFFIIELYLLVFCIQIYVITATSVDSSSTEETKYLKCTYLFSALTHMKITQLMLKNTDLNLIIAIVNVSRYVEIVIKQISTLYEKNKMNIGSLWLLNLYLSSILGLSTNSNNILDIDRDDNRYKTIEDTHDYVLQILQQDAINCDRNNVFNIHILEFEHQNTESMTILDANMYNNIKYIQTFIKNRNSPKLLNSDNLQTFTKKGILMTRLSKHISCIVLFQYFYDVQVDWSYKMARNFKKMLKKANTLQWSGGNFKSIIDYYVVFFNFFKVIMLRLTWKHFLYLQHQNINVVEYLTKEWLLILNDFSQLTCIENDSDIVEITLSINEFISYIPKNRDGSVDEDEFPNYKEQCYLKLESELKIILTDICVPLECYAIEPLFLFGQEQPNVANKPPHNHDELKTVDYYSLLNAKMFLKNIILNTKNIDLDVIKSFISYIKKISCSICMKT
ncbi:uncharacterized protein LOC126903060 [Daktulosphaira vitifoliae]|uniref:uncharacterized protein LOC126903060 n=1 Tax=Daktulosphaira vitifoliae TaxID=58002 RepID=UPI0021A98D5E|nr:uncharacterized protein LOC126903060 [Daktulosphaira vitifoliae]